MVVNDAVSPNSNPQNSCIRGDLDETILEGLVTMIASQLHSATVTLIDTKLLLPANPGTR